MDSIVDTLAGSSLNSWVISNSWNWAVMEIVHFCGLSLLLGSLIVIDGRMAGHFKKIDLVAAHKLLPVTFVGFGLNMITGILFFAGDPARYAINIGFQIKMLLVILAGLNAGFYYWKIHPNLGAWSADDTSTPLLARAIAYTSLGLWIGVLLLGRLIPYVGTG